MKNQIILLVLTLALCTIGGCKKNADNDDSNGQPLLEYTFDGITYTPETFDNYTYFELQSGYEYSEFQIRAYTDDKYLNLRIVNHLENLQPDNGNLVSHYSSVHYGPHGDCLEVGPNSYVCNVFIVTLAEADFSSGYSTTAYDLEYVEGGEFVIEEHDVENQTVTGFFNAPLLSAPTNPNSKTITGTFNKLPYTAF